MNTTTNFNLSDKREWGNGDYHEKDIKEIIRLVLEINKTAHSRHQKEVLIKRVAGDKLIETDVKEVSGESKK